MQSLNNSYQINSLEELNDLAQVLKKDLLENSANRKNQLIFFEANMGCGKTTFTRKLIQSFNPKLKVTSPTFTGMHLHTDLEIDFYHYDLYQVELNLEEFSEILKDSKKKIIFFEWAENLDQDFKNELEDENTRILLIKINVDLNETRNIIITSESK